MSVSMDNLGHLHRQCYYMMHYLLISGIHFKVRNSGLPFVSGSGIHSMYLTFLDICPDGNIFRYVNYATRAVKLLSHFILEVPFTILFM